MHRMRLIVSLACVAAAAAFPAASQATEASTNITITGGTLTYTTPFSAGNFPTTKLTGLPQPVEASVSPWVVTDNRGTGAGWNVTISASRFKCSISTECGTTEFPASSLTLAAVVVPSTSTENLIGPPPAVAPLYVPPVTPLDNGGAAQKIATAAAAPLNGSGAWTFTYATGLKLIVPASTKPGTYTSTITTTLANGP